MIWLIEKRIKIGYQLQQWRQHLSMSTSEPTKLLQYCNTNLVLHLRCLAEGCARPSLPIGDDPRPIPPTPLFCKSCFKVWENRNSHNRYGTILICAWQENEQWILSANQIWQFGGPSRNMCVWGCHLILEAGGCSSFPCDRDCIPDISEPSIRTIQQDTSIL